MYHPIKEQDMRALAEYQRSLFVHPKLEFLFFEMTDQCNMHCRHCGSSCEEANSTYLPYDVIERTLHRVAEVYDSKTIMVNFTGGEPMLHSGIFRSIRAAHDLGFFVGMTSNGTLIDKEKALRLVQAGLNTISISIDGIGKVHDDFRNKTGSFELAIAGIRALKDAGIEPQPITVVHKGNIGQMEELYHFMNQNEIASWRLTNIDPIGRARSNSDLLLDADELKTLYDFIFEKRMSTESPMEIEYGCSHFLTFEYEKMLRDFYFQCLAGTKLASIMANGNIGACLDIERRPELVQGNIYTDDFIDVWENRFQVFRTDRTKQSKTCSQCQHKDVCLGDSTHTWDYDEQEPVYCVAKKLEEVI